LFRYIIHQYFSQLRTDYIRNKYVIISDKSVVFVFLVVFGKISVVFGSFGIYHRPPKLPGGVDD